MTEPTNPPPHTPDGSELTPEEWDAVRRLRERAAPSPSSTVDPPTYALPPVAPAPPPEQTAPPVEPVEQVGPAEPVEPVEPQTPPAQAQTAETTVLEAAETEAPSEEVIEPEPEPASEPLARRQLPAAVPAVAAAVVLAVVSAVLAAVVGLKVSDQHARNTASTDALAAATSGVATVLSYNYRSLDADFAKAETLLTPAFRKTYDATTASGVKPLAAKYKAVSSAQVIAAGGISASASKATVLVFVNQQVTNTQLSAPRLDRSRIQVDLVKTHGRWLISKLTPL